MISVMKRQKMASLSNMKRKKKVKIKGKKKSNLILLIIFYEKFFN